MDDEIISQRLSVRAQSPKTGKTSRKHVSVCLLCVFVCEGVRG